MSRNSFGPLRRRRLRVLRSSSGVDGSISLSICWAAKSRAFDAASELRRRNGCDAASQSRQVGGWLQNGRLLRCERPSSRLQQLDYEVV